MSVLEGIEPVEVFKYFEEICGIPHGSGNIKQISDYLVNFAKERNLRYIQDDSGNVIIFKDGTPGYEQSETVIIQGHMDMVCEKDNDCDIDFTKDGLRLDVADGYVYAKGTTLGGDDGIAVAYALAILDNADGSIKHPPLEVVITVDEEIGLLGATALDCSVLKGKIFLNIDSEDEGIILVSCAGGVTAECTLPVEFENKDDLEAYKIVVTGIAGGHSGVEINKQGANSNVVMGRILAGIDKVSPLRIIDLNGGKKDNAIPRETVAIVGVSKYSNEEDMNTYIDNIGKVLANEYRTTDSEISVTIDKVAPVAKVMTKESTDKVICALRNLPNGVLKMNSDIEGLVQTSLNLGVLLTEEDRVRLHYSVRSSVGTEKDELTDRIDTLISMLGGHMELIGAYPAWEYNPDSKLRDIMVKTHIKLFNAAPKIEAIHAGLECGIFAGKIEGLDCVSYGPNMDDIHTSSEKLYIDSTARYWEYTKAILKALK
ncbi:MAG: aminoacyl-histidine dipeptidase [Lachnospiraceae bacterium]|nr:aminoacyl-histidine dipeptidase [Lachnospiraceae bacterium]